MDRVAKYLRWLVGVTFLIAGVAKFLSWPETRCIESKMRDVPQQNNLDHSVP